jgi:arginine-tRNA-protein transferase
MRKVQRRNQQMTAMPVNAKATAEQFRLFARYQESRHSGGDMALMGFYDYRSMIEDSTIDSFVVEFRGSDGMLKAAILVDRMSDGLSAVYSFYDPVLSELSLGTYMILWLVEEAERQGLPYVYLGYWIAESNKMAYKARFQPLEAYSTDGWLPFALPAEETPPKT